MDKAQFSDFDPCWTVEKQARWWVVHMDLYGEDAAVRTRFETWLAKDVDHAVAYHQSKNLWSDMALAFDIGDEDDPPAPTPPAAHPPVIPFLWFLPKLDWYMADYTNETPRPKKIVLADGTTVTLDGKSAVDVDYREGLRQISLVAGQAFFDVQPSAQTPFVVQTGRVAARALGTAYSVREYEGRITVSVREGRVAVSAGSIENTVQLHAMERVTLESGTGRLQKTRVSQNAFAWLQGHLIAQNRLLHDVLGELERYSNSRIFVLNTALRQKKISGRFDVTDAMQVIEDIALLLNADLVKITDGIIFIR